MQAKNVGLTGTIYASNWETTQRQRGTKEELQREERGCFLFGPLFSFLSIKGLCSLEWITLKPENVCIFFH